VVIKLSGEEKSAKIAEMKVVSENIKVLEGEVRELKESLDNLVAVIPNLTWEGMPAGKDSNSNLETAVYGSKPEFDFVPKNYYDLPLFKRDYLSQKGVEAAGFRGYYVTGELAKFQRVLFNWVLDRLIKLDFEYVIPPIAVTEDLMKGTGFFPSGKDDVFVLSDGKDTKFVPGTSEPQLMFRYSNETLDLTQPKKLTAWTTCFRKEIGSYGKDVKGGFRVHQFEKIETVFICKPEDVYSVFDQMTAVFHDTLDQLGIYYHDLETCTGDNSLKNHRMIDIEAWFPAEERFRELCSSSICTDYQTRNLNIKYKKDDGTSELAYSLNCTGITSRTMLVVMEQFQQADGRVKIPAVLQDRFGKEFLE
jgi:seryl-tRNA synthetase